MNLKHDDILERQGPRGMSWKTNPVPIDPILAKGAKYNLNLPDHFQAKLFQRQTEEEEIEHYARLCRGEQLRVSKILSIKKFKIINNKIKNSPQ